MESSEDTREHSDGCKVSLKGSRCVEPFGGSPSCPLPAAHVGPSSLPCFSLKSRVSSLCHFHVPSCAMRCLFGLFLLLLLLDGSPLMAIAAGIGGGVRRLQTNDTVVSMPQLKAPIVQPSLPSFSPSDAVANVTIALLSPPRSLSVATPRFEVSRSGQPMVVWESPPSFWPRGLMVLLVVAQGLAALLWMMLQGADWMRKPLLAHSRAIQQLLRSVLLWTVISVVLHTFHYADNIWDPVAYCEPRWLYRAWVATEMEITFVFFTPLTMMALAIAGIVMSFPIYAAHSVMGLAMARPLLGLSALYLAASALSGGHYAVEPPSAYALQANIAIIGEVIAATIVLIQAWRVHRMAASVVVRPGLYSSVDSEERISPSAR